MKPESTYYTLSHHSFVKEVLVRGTKINKELYPSGSFIKANPEALRDPTEEEFYCLQLGNSLAHLMTVIQQLEHTIFYMSNFSPTSKMKEVGINRSTHLLWSVENYIIRTQSVYDRLLISIDRLFHIQNQANRISHESIVTNSHISRTSIPSKLKKVKASVKKYYRDRNKIIHEESYLDDELRRIELLSIISSDPDEEDNGFKDDLKWFVNRFVKTHKAEFAKTNTHIMNSLTDLFDEMHKVYTKRYNELCNKNC